eukprot:scaffold74063_cov63-Phaeocystis_antarctica.AAC.1
MELTEARERLQWRRWPMWAVTAAVWGTGNEALLGWLRHEMAREECGRLGRACPRSRTPGVGR